MSIQVTVGQIPGTATDVTLDSVRTVAEAIRVANLSADGYEIRVNNVVTTNFNHELNDDDIVSLVKNVKGNSGVSLITVNVTLPDGTEKKAHIAKGSFLVSIKTTLSVPGKFDDYAWTVNGESVDRKDFELNKNCDVAIFYKIAGPSETETTEPKAKKKTTKLVKKAEKAREDAIKSAEKEKEDMLVYVTYDDGEEFALELPHKSRITAVLKHINKDAKWNEYKVTKNGAFVKFAFMELKDGDKIVILSLKTLSPSSETETEPVEPKAKEKAPSKKKRSAIKTEDCKADAISKNQAVEPESVSESTTECEAEPTEAKVPCDCNTCPGCCADTESAAAEETAELEEFFDRVRELVKGKGYEVTNFYLNQTSSKTYRATDSINEGSTDNTDEVYIGITLNKQN